MRRFATAALILSVGAAPVGAADLFQDKSKRKMFAAQTKFLDTRGATQYRGSERLKPDTLKSDILPIYNGSYRGEYLEVARSAAAGSRTLHLPIGLIKRTEAGAVVCRLPPLC